MVAGPKGRNILLYRVLNVSQTLGEIAWSELCRKILTNMGPLMEGLGGLEN